MPAPKAARVRNPEPACRPASRSRDRRARRADLSDDVLRVSGFGSRRGAVQSRTRRAHLHAHFQPDDRGARGAAGGARGRRRRDLHRERHGRDASGDRHAAQRRRPYRRLVLALWRHRSICWRTPCRASASPRPSSSRAISTRSARRSGPNTRLVIGETIGNPGLEVLDIPAVAAIAHAAKDPAADRQHLCDALSQPPDRAWRRHRDELGDQMDRRPWHRDRRRDRRRRPVRLARLRQVPGADRTLCRLSRHRFRRAVRPGRLHHAGAHRGPARFRRLPVADQRVPAAAGRRDAGRSHGPPYRQHQRGAGRSWPRTRRSIGCCIPRWKTIPIMQLAKAPAAARRRLDRQFRHQGRPRGGQASSSRRCG